MNTSSIQKQIKNLGQNKILLYILLILSVTNVFGYIMSDNLIAVLMFIVVGYLSTFFTKNMNIILASAIITTNFVVAMNFSRGNKEGLDNPDKKIKDGNSEKKSTSLQGEKHLDPKTIDLSTAVDTAKKTKSAGFDKLSYDEISGKPKNTNPTDSQNVALVDKPNVKNTDEKSVVNGADEDELKKKSTKLNVNRAKTFESAYDNLNKMLGSDALKAMTDDTQKLASQQATLLKNIEKLEPMMNMAGGLLDKLEGSKIGGMIAGMGDVISKTQQ